MVVLKPSCREPAGRRSDLPCGVTAMPSTQYSILASCLRYLTRVFPLPVPAHSSHSEQPRFASLPRSRTHYSTCPERGREAGERPVCSVATSGCPTRSEDGFPVGARNIPPRPVQPSLTTTSNPKNKAPNHKVRGFEERLTGIEPAYQAWEACALPLSYSRIFFSVSRLLAGGEMCCGCLCAGVGVEM